MAREFLQRGDAVVLCGRSEERLGAAVDALRSEWPGTEVCTQASVSLDASMCPPIRPQGIPSTVLRQQGKPVLAPEIAGTSLTSAAVYMW